LGGQFLTGADFIQFCLRLYAAPGVGKTCLQLQDEHGLNVNCLLLAAWGAALGYCLKPETWVAITARTAVIRNKAVAPIRTARRTVSSEPHLDEDLKRPLKRLLLYAEVRAEQAEERALHRLMLRSAARSEPGEPLLRLNLAAYASPSINLERFATLVVDARFMELLPCPRQPND
jgi:uncharacterized protein (TIGR02444 family)